MWTLFHDMNSGGGRKEKWAKIYIEAPKEEAIIIFYNRFGHNPERVTCTCCGEDYSISSEKTLALISGFHRNCQALETPRGEHGFFEKPKDPWWHEHYYLEKGEEEEAKKRGYKISAFPRFGEYQTWEEYIKNKNVLVIYAKDIKPEEREGEVPQQGYIWVD